MTNSVNYEQIPSNRNFIYDARISKGFSQDAVAAMCGISTGQYQAYEYGRKNFDSSSSFRTGLRICYYLDIDPLLIEA